MSSPSKKVCPQKRGSVFGKLMAASTWLAAMSASRAAWSHVPLRMSSKVVRPNPSSSKPTAADTIMRGETKPS